MRRLCGGLVLLLAAAILPFAAGVRPARATLGESSASVARDAARMKASVTQSAAPAPPTGARTASPYSVAMLKAPDGTVVREYVTSGGTVFAIAWRGPMPPDVALLLGAYFNQYRETAERTPPAIFGLHHALVTGPDVTVETGGHMGELWGRAWLPAMLPPGVEESQIE
ncbi:MAG TPA: DUF2844 domain-containing protein [Candidatus Binataceae bacterium]|jgi:hypothetical protein|nr:DUF2844 domain-containing protein [Candidatus Binataceae bacterium]